MCRLQSFAIVTAITTITTYDSMTYYNPFRSLSWFSRFSDGFLCVSSPEPHGLAPVDKAANRTLAYISM